MTPARGESWPANVLNRAVLSEPPSRLRPVKGERMAGDSYQPARGDQDAGRIVGFANQGKAGRKNRVRNPDSSGRRRVRPLSGDSWKLALRSPVVAYSAPSLELCLYASKAFNQDLLCPSHHPKTQFYKRRKQPMKLQDIKPNMPVTYVPTHANGSASHPDSEPGTVREIRGEYVFVAFSGRGTAQACKAEQLVRG